MTTTLNTKRKRITQSLSQQSVIHPLPKKPKEKANVISTLSINMNQIYWYVIFLIKISDYNKNLCFHIGNQCI